MWQKRTEHVDPIEGVHVVRLHDPERSDKPEHDHLVQIVVGSRGCPYCGRAYDAQGAAVDPQAVVQGVTHRLKRVGQRMAAYAKRHGVPLKKA